MGFLGNALRPGVLGGEFMLRMMDFSRRDVSDWGMSKISVNERADILDAGCGSGANMAAWLKKCGQGHVTGIDYSKACVEISGRRNASALREKRCRVVRGSVSDLPFADGTFDCVSAFETIYFWQDLKQCFREVHRVLKKGGLFLICNDSDGKDSISQGWARLNGNGKMYTRCQICAALKEAGFSRVESYGDVRKHRLCIVVKK